MYIKLKKIEDNNMVFNIFDKKDDLFLYKDFKIDNESKIEQNNTNIN